MTHPEHDPWVLLRDVLAEAAGVDPSSSFDEPARALAARLRGVKLDWARRPQVRESTAGELLESLRAEAAARRAEIEERQIEADQRWRDSLPVGIPVGQVPDGISAGLLMMLKDPEYQRARRRSVVEDALARTGTVFTPIQPERADE